ncbi:MAG TPA: hypothetical protein VNQ77_18370 [Frankiaceae bacterium]|nr:hypothetical protein [Frankiaceae bacterium]
MTEPEAHVDVLLAEFKRRLTDGRDVLLNAPETVDFATYDAFRVRLSEARNVLDALHSELERVLTLADALFAEGSADRREIAERLHI